MRATTALKTSIGLTLAATAFTVTAGCSGATSANDLVSTLTAGTTDATKQASALTGTTAAAASTGTATNTQSSAPQPPMGPGGGHAGPPGHGLTDEQRTALQALQDSLAAGTITQDEFCQQLHDLLGDPACGPPLPPINLTDDQVTQATTIFQQAHDQIVTLHQTAHDQVLAQLTADQQTALTTLESENTPPAPPDQQGAPACPPPDDAACTPPVAVPLPPCPSQDGQPGEPPAGPLAMGPAAQGTLAVCLSSDTIAALALTDAQVTAIEGIHSTLQSSEASVQDAAQQAFLALLTADQLQQLDQLPSPMPPGPPQGPPPGAPSGQ